MNNRKARFRKVLALVLSLAMVAASSTMVYADVTPQSSPQSASVTAEANTEAFFDKDIFRIQLPTVSAADFALILDPQGVIDETNQAAYTGKTFESGAKVFFRNTSGNAAYSTDYSHQSDIISVNNTGGVSVNVAVQVSVNDADGIKFVDTNSFTDDTDKMAKMYIGIEAKNDGGSSTDGEKALSNNKAAKVSENVAGDPTNFEVSYNGAQYFLSENSAATWKKMTFQLTAGINPYGDFADLNAPKLDIIWTVKDASGPKIRLSKDGLIKMTNLTAERNLSYDGPFAEDDFGSTLGGAAIYNVDKGQFAYLTAGEAWNVDSFSFETGGTATVQLADAWMSAWAGDEVYARLYLTDGTTIDSTHVIW